MFLALPYFNVSGELLNSEHEAEKRLANFSHSKTYKAIYTSINQLVPK